MKASKSIRKRKRQLAHYSARLTSAPLFMHAGIASRILTALSSGDSEGLKAVGAMFGGAPEHVDAEASRTGTQVIPVTGVLMEGQPYFFWDDATSYLDIECALKEAAADDKVERVLLYVNSPGGEAIGCRRIAWLVRKFTKPIEAFVQGMCCSAAYAIASAAQKIHATNDSSIGCLGAIYPHVDATAFYEKMGLDWTVVVNEESPKKKHGTEYEALTPEAKKTLEAYVNDYGGPFLTDVATFRGLPRETVVKQFGEGDTRVAGVALERGMIDSIVSDIGEVLESFEGGLAERKPTSRRMVRGMAAVGGNSNGKLAASAGGITSLSEGNKMNKKTLAKIKAMLFSLGLIANPNISQKQAFDLAETFLAAKGKPMPKTASEILSALRMAAAMEDDAEPKEEGEEDEPAAEGDDIPAEEGDAVPDDDDDLEEEDDEAPDSEGEDDEPAAEGEDEEPTAKKAKNQAAVKIRAAHKKEFAEAKAEAKREVEAANKRRLIDLRATARLLNEAMGETKITNSMVNAAYAAGLTSKDAPRKWTDEMAKVQSGVAANRVNVGRDGKTEWMADAVDALAMRHGVVKDHSQLRKGAAALANRPAWALAETCLEMRGKAFDRHGDREEMILQALEGSDTSRKSWSHPMEHPRYVGANTPAAPRVGDFANLLSAWADKIVGYVDLSNIMLDSWTAVLPRTLDTFHAVPVINVGQIEEIDHIFDDEEVKQSTMKEELLSFLQLEEYANRVGLTPRIIAQDTLGDVVNMAQGFPRAWMMTQLRLCLTRLTSTENLLDGSALFADRGTGLGGGNNKRASGAAPSDTEWGEMEKLRTDIKGVKTHQRIRGELNTILVPTGAAHIAARRTFETFPVIGETKVPATQAELGLYRGKVTVIPEPELKAFSATKYYGFHSPGDAASATIVRVYSSGYGQFGRREQYYDPAHRTLWQQVSYRVAVGVRNWRDAIENNGA